MEDALKQFVKDNYRGSRDLYTAFIERCLELADDDDYVTMVTPENFMFLYSYRGLRKELISDAQIIEGAHLSGHSFPPKDRPFTIPFVLSNRDPENFRSSRFYRMTHEQDEYAHHEDKIRGLNTITEANRRRESHEDVYVVDQNSFLEIERTPILYWFGDTILGMFTKYPKLGDFASVNEGIGSGDDDYFIRDWWEIPSSWVGNRYKWIMMSGDDVEYYYSTTKTALWEEDGEELINHPRSNPRNLDEQQKGGLSYRNFGKLFAARTHPEGYLFSNKSPFINVNERKYQVLGYLCSTLTRYIMNGLNPGINFNTGDGKRIPIKPKFSRGNDIKKLVEEAIQARKSIYSQKEIRKEFSGEDLIKNPGDRILHNELLIAHIRIIHGVTDDIINQEYGLDDDTVSRLYENLPKNLANHPHIKNTGELDTPGYEFRTEVQTKVLPKGEYQELIADVDRLKDNDICEISEELEVSPYTVAMMRHKHDLYTRDEKRKTAGRLLSYYLGCSMGRWELEDLAPDDNGITVFDSDFEDNVMSYMRRCIELTYGEDKLYEKETEIEEMLNKSIEDWLRNTFFRYHHCKEYRRRGQRIPIYWQLESEEGAFSCFVYYHKMDADTLPKLRGKYIDKKLDTLQNRLEAIESELEAADGDHARNLRSEKEEIQADIDEITEFRDRIDALIDEGFEPNFEAGIWENIQKVDDHDLLAVPLDKL